VKRWMQAADGFVLSSLWEGLPMAVLEAAACALPAVATNVPGTGEAIMDGETGLLAPAADACALARSMTAFMQLPIGKRAAMGARARQHATEQFSLAASLDRWEKLYGELSSRSCLLKREACTRQSASSS
jgi:glycosyltransferase involved in cell wall biosynthesis